MPKTRSCALFLLCVCCSAVGQQASPAAPPEPPKVEDPARVPPPVQQKKDELEACPATFNDSLDINGITPRVGGNTGISPPRLTHKAETHIPNKPEDPARDKMLEGDGAVILISLVVDVKGKPTEICLKKAVGLGLDEEAYKAVRQYRFMPAKKGKEPVAARITVEIDLHRY